jgi:hypothetical protein
MTNAATWMPEKRTQTPSPSPDLIPAKNHQPETYIGIGTSDGGTSMRPPGRWPAIVGERRKLRNKAIVSISTRLVGQGRS